MYALFVVVLIALATTADWESIRTNFFDEAVWKDLWPDLILVAAWNTIKYTALSFAGALALALVLALMRMSPVAPYRWLATLFIETFRGLPALVVIILLAFGVPLAFGYNWPEIGWLGLSSNTTGGILALILVGSAYMAETLRAGIQAVPKGQAEAARSLGMSAPRTMVTVVLPQAVRVVIPPMTNEFVLLLKDTALLSVIGMQAVERDLLAFGQNGLTTYANSSPLMAVAIVYLLIAIPITQLVAWMERRQQKAR
ncbi:amino acid ABC transporter permease [Nocardioides jishulii]|uniref:Amino acid ABC transporter permease n=2 Tax=Nocardioides jishulii TaxID=2575440 RepID=A0A4U2YLP5_9ACTN|nr:amino acid ABC transporter permease [Nocardioides jishulii]TKI61840.1 amino acid ABC transporter permease [Nocardioides jishulii]